MTNRDKFLEILKEHGIYDDDVEEIIYAMEDMLHYVASKTEAEEPYAYKYIDRVNKAAEEVRSLIWELEDE